MTLPRYMLKRVGESGHSRRTPTVVQNQSTMLPLKMTALVAVIKVVDDSVKVGPNFVLLHGCPQIAACKTLWEPFFMFMKTW